jgi:hypothetical protein
MMSIFEKAIRHSESTPTPSLRFVERNGARILQQGWAMKIYDTDALSGIKVSDIRLEWRDVPVEKE